MQVVVINLDRTPERLETFRAQAEQLGFPFARIVAIDASEVRERRARMSVGEIACFHSHRLAWRALIDSGEPWMAVFEDDVVLAPAIAPLLRTADWIPAGVDLVKFETFMARTKIAPEGTEVAGVHLHRLQATHCGSAGYVLSRRAAQWLLDRSQSFTRPVDIVMFHFDQESCRRLHIAQAVPALCIQERFLQEGEPPRHPGLIERSEVFETPRLRGAAKFGHEAKRVLRQLSRPRLIREALRPSRRLVVPFLEN